MKVFGWRESLVDLRMIIDINNFDGQLPSDAFIAYIWNLGMTISEKLCNDKM